MELAASAFFAMATEGAAMAVPAALSTVAEGAALAGPSLAAGVPAAASTVGGAAGAGSGMLSALQGGMTVASAISSILGGVSSYQDSRNKARFAEIDAENERLKAEDQANRIRREMVQRVGDARVAYAASGQDVSSAGSIEGALRSQAAHETELALSSAEMRRAGGLAKAAQLRSQATAGLLSGIVKSGGQLANFDLDLKKRG